MSEKPLFAYDYKRENVELVRQTCLYVATKLGDLLDDLVVVVQNLTHRNDFLMCGNRCDYNIVHLPYVTRGK